MLWNQEKYGMINSKTPALECFESDYQQGLDHLLILQTGYKAHQYREESHILETLVLITV